MPKKLTNEQLESRERLRLAEIKERGEARKIKATFAGKAKLLKAGKSRKIKGRDSRKAISSRARRFSNLSKAFGTQPGGASGAGAGRPKGSYKYRIGGKPASVFEYRKFMAQRKQQLAQFQDQQNQRLAQKGFEPEQIQQLRKQHIVRRVQQGKPEMESNVADQELAFRKHLADTTVSPRTQAIMVALRRTQNLAKTANIEQQRRHHERRIVERGMNLMHAHENMVPVRLDMTGVNDQENILMAPSVFKEDGTNNILRTNRVNLMQTREAGNNLKFF